MPAPSANGTTRLVHIDPEPDYRLLVRTALAPEADLAVVGGAGDLTAGLEVVRETRPDVVLVEPHLGAHADVDGLVELQSAAPHVRTLVLSSLPARELACTGPGTGVRGHLSKRMRPTALAGEIRQMVRVLDVVGAAIDEANTELDPDLVSPRRAREFVSETLERWQCRDATAIIDLLVSEIVANAVMHAATSSELSVQLLEDRVRISLTDYDTTQPKRKLGDPLTSTGRGIALIEKLSLAWGIDRTPEGKRIWFETPRPDEAVSPP